MGNVKTEKCDYCGNITFVIEARETCDGCEHDYCICDGCEDGNSHEGIIKSSAEYQCECKIGSNYGCGCHIYRCSKCNQLKFFPMLES